MFIYFIILKEKRKKKNSLQFLFKVWFHMLWTLLSLGCDIEALEAFVQRFGRDQCQNLQRGCEGSHYFQGSFGQSQRFASIWKLRQQALHGHHQFLSFPKQMFWFFQFSEIWLWISTSRFNGFMWLQILKREEIKYRFEEVTIHF